MTGPCFRCFLGQHDRCEGVARPLGLPSHACVCDGCGLLDVTPAVPYSPPVRTAGVAQPK